MRKRRRFSEEFKQHAVELAKQAGVTKRQIAEELGKARDDEIAALTRELARKKRSRIFFREAVAFFARESNIEVRRAVSTASPD
jgi:transposase